jgi:hypothetical protein
MEKKALMKRKKSRTPTRPVKAKVRKKVRQMSDKPKPWPYQAAEARDRSAEEAQVIVKNAEDALEMTNDPGLLRKLGRIVASGNVILRLLEGQGAKTRPPAR